MNHLTPGERERYRDGSWLKDDRPRCRLCGDLQMNHEPIEGGWGKCEVCTCSGYVEEDE